MITLSLYQFTGEKILCDKTQFLTKIYFANITATFEDNVDDFNW